MRSRLPIDRIATQEDRSVWTLRNNAESTEVPQLRANVLSAGPPVLVMKVAEVPVPAFLFVQISESDVQADITIAIPSRVIETSGSISMHGSNATDHSMM